MPAGPRGGGVMLSSDLSREFLEIGVPSVRLHDVEYPYGKNQFIDIHCIFPDKNADENLPESYNFAPTDAYLRAVKDVGADILFRLGESTDLFPRTLYTSSPNDLEKYAGICEHILMHYNEGWADGLKINIRRVEICGAADDLRVFSGSQSEFFELYRVVANRIRERFPRVKIGGYGCGGFYAVNRLSSTEEQKKYIPFMRAFLRYITAEETKAPLDFFTWYAYPTTPEELALHARYARSVLDEYGLKRTSSVICGFNASSFLSDDISEKPAYISELFSLIVAMQKSDVEQAYFADSPMAASYGKSFLSPSVQSEKCPVYHALSAFGELFKLGAAYESTADLRSELYSLSAASDCCAEVVIVTRSFSGNLELRALGLDAERCKIRRIAARGADTSSVSSVGGELAVKDGRVTFRADKDAVYIIEIPR